MSRYFDSITRLWDASELYDKIKMKFPNKELQEAIRLFIEPALDKRNNDYEVESASSSKMHIVCRNEVADFYLESFSNYYDGGGLIITINFVNHDTLHKHISVNYEIKYDDKEGILKVSDTSYVVSKNDKGRIVKTESVLINRTYKDNMLRHEIKNDEVNDLLNGETSSTIMEVLIDLDNNAVVREIITNKNVSIKYYETDDYYAPPFNDLRNSIKPKKNILNETSKQVFNDFKINDNNLSPKL